MKAIICGAGFVGQGIARQLAGEKNEVTIIDQSPGLLREISETLDVRVVIGHGSHPDTLEQAGAREADILIAVTAEDEVNMMICQIAYSLFKVPRKVARIRHQSYTNNIWKGLFDDREIPVDVVISPEVELGRAVLRRLEVPGAFEAIDFAGGRVRLAGIAIEEDCPVAETPLDQLPGLFPGLRSMVSGIARQGQMIVPHGSDHIEAGDDVYFIADARDVSRTLAIFGHQESRARRILIAGASEVALYVAGQLERLPGSPVTVRLIEPDRTRAIAAADALQKSIVLHGSPFDAELLREAGVAQSEAFVALSPSDETNMLSAVMAKHEGSQRAICLYNNRSYRPLMRRLGIDAYLSRSALTISTILRHTRRGPISALHSLQEGAAEVIEATAMETARIVGQNLRDAAIPDGIKLGAIWRRDDFVMPENEAEIRPGDKVVLFSLADQIPEVENLFRVGVAYF